MSRIPKNILPIWLAQLISTSGDAIYQIALVWLVLDITGSNTITGLVVLAAHLPAMVFGLFAGVLADRYNRVNLMLISNLCQALTVIMIPLLISYGYTNAALIGLLAFIRSSFGTIFPPALNSHIPTMVKPQFLVRVNSLLATSAQLAYLIGPASAAILLNIISLKHLFTIDSATFVIALVLLTTLRTNTTRQTGGESAPSWKQLKHGVAYVRKHVTIGLIVLLTIINNLFIMGPAIVGMPILVKNALGGTASDFATVEASYAIGMLASSLLIYRFGDRFRKGRMLMLGMIVDGLTYCLLFLANSIPMVIVLIIIHALGIPMITVSRTAIIQRYVPNELQGRVFSMIHLAVVGLTGISSALVGIIAEILAIKTVFLLIGIGAALCGLYGLLYKSIRELQ